GRNESADRVGPTRTGGRLIPGLLDVPLGETRRFTVEAAAGNRGLA
ncbi:MAG: hypothetical protein JWO22_4244, partial [Frankiales bacterium]|nr:hypothetical protein [Frankiales bacterium]